MLSSLTTGRRKWYFAGSGVLLVAAAAWGVTGYYGRTHDPAGLPPELSRENLKAISADTQKMMETMHDMWQRTDLTEEQQREAMRRMRELGEARMDQRIQEYVTASADQKQAIIDRHIEEMQKEREQREAQREQMDRQHDPNRPRDPNQARDPNRPRRPDFASMSPQERKTRSESRDPDKQAQRMAYFSALRARATERGIQMPWGPPGAGRGGPR